MRKSILSMAVIAACAVGGTAHAASNGTTGTWNKIADASASFTVTGTRFVRYGAGTKWVMKGMTGKGTCSTAFFGKDPAPGVTKTCEMFVSGPAPTAYNVKLSWTIPATRQNGKPLALSELKGYEVYYATDNDTSTANDSIVHITGGAITSTIAKLPAGTYYFTISAIDINGMKSPLSTMVSTKVGG